MMHYPQGTMLFKEPPGAGPLPDFDVLIDTEDETDPFEKKMVLCSQCLAVIADPDDKMSVDNSHTHIFSNAHGIVFEIGCYKTASNLINVGEPTFEWSWFPGYAWRISACGSCMTHLGWRYDSYGGTSFYGLILDRILIP